MSRPGAFSRSTAKAVLPAVFFVSGFSGLVYEVLWIRDFGFILGNSVYTVSVVLAAYMAGLALGSAFAGRFSRSVANPLRAYAVLEAGIAVSGLAIFAAFQGALRDLGPVGVLGAENLVPFLQRFGISFSILLVPTFLMGATLPLLVQQSDPGKEGGTGITVGLLYGMNTLGAAAGCFVTGFFLIRLLGIRATTFVAVGLNLLAAVAALVMARFSGKAVPETVAVEPAPAAGAGETPPAPAPSGGRLDQYSPAVATTEMAARLGPVAPAAAVAGTTVAETSLPRAPEVTPETGLEEGISRGEARLFLVLFGLSGFTSLAYEVVYFRLLSYIVGNRVFASTLMITIFLLGMGVGALVGARFVDRMKRELGLFSALQLLTALSAVLVVGHFPAILAAFERFEAAAGPTRQWEFVRLRVAEAGVLLAVPALSFGLMFPLAVRYYGRSAAAMSGAAGAVYSVNTVGCIAGSLGAGFVLIPVLGGYRAMVAVAVLSALLGHRLLAPRWGAAGWRRRLASIVLVATLGIALGGWALRNDSYPWGRPGLEMVFSREEPGALVTVYRGPMGFYLYGDDTPLAFPIGPNTKTVGVQRAQAQIPLLLHPAPRRVLVVGLGFGVTSGEFAQCPLVERVDTVELLSGVIEAAPMFAQYNYGVRNDARSNIVEGDGRYFLRHAREPYDIITSNLVGADMPGSASCYTLEYFRLAKSRLAPGGLFLLHAFGGERSSIYRTLAEVFPHAMVFGAYTNSMYLVASMEPIRLYPRAIEAKLAADPAFRARAEANGLGSYAALRKRMLIRDADLGTFARKVNAPLNTDTEPVLEFSFHGHRHDIFRSYISKSLHPGRAGSATVSGDQPNDGPGMEPPR